MTLLVAYEFLEILACLFLLPVTKSEDDLTVSLQNYSCLSF